MKNIIVQKFGGTSVGSTQKIKNVAQRVIQAKKKGNNVVVVISAMGHTTDELVSLAKKINPNPPLREYDALLATGEQISSALLAMAIEAQGYKAISLTGKQAGIVTEDIHSKARILAVDAKRLKSSLKEGKIVVVAGFQGINSFEDITTIGRGGSDTSAVVLAAALGAKECEIYTDVDGVYTTDPRIVPNAKKLAAISYEEMLEMASLGAAVLHSRAVEAAKENNVIIHVRSSYNNHIGTLVKEEKNMERKRVVSGVTCDTNIAKVSILDVPDLPGMAAKIFGGLAAENINVDMIIQSEHKQLTNDISFTVCADDIQKTIETAKKISREIGADGVTEDKNVAKVSIVGVGMISAPGVAAKMFEALAKEKINIEMISTSEIKVSCVIREKDAHKAVKALHKKFGLQK
jgi:aspartate kinase